MKVHNTFYVWSCSFTVPMVKIGNHFGTSGKIYVIKADRSGQGSWLPSQSNSTLYSRGLGFQTHPRPCVIFSGDYNNPPLSPGNARVLFAVMMEHKALSPPSSTDIFFSDTALGSLISTELLYIFFFTSTWHGIAFPLELTEHSTI